MEGGPQPLPVSERFVALFGSHAAAWLGHAAALKRFLDFWVLGLEI